MTTLALKPVHTFVHPLHRRSTSLHTAPTTVTPSTAGRAIRQVVAVVALIAASVGAPFLTLLTPQTPYASRVLELEHAQDLAATWQASHTSVGTRFESPMMEQWLLTPASALTPTPGLT